MRLELRSILLGKLLWVDLFATLFLFGDLVAFLVDLLGLGCWLLWSDVEDLVASGVADGIAVQDVTSILAVILAESPTESLTEHLLRDLLLVFVVFVVLVDLTLEIEWHELILGRSFIFSQLFKLFFVILLAIILRFSCLSAFFATFSTFFSWLLTLAFFGLLIVFFFLFALVGFFTFFTAKLGSSTCLLLLFASEFCLALLFLEAGLLYGALLSELLKSLLLALSVVILSLFLFIPVLDVMEDLLLMNVRHTIVLSQLGCIEGLSTAWFARDSNLEWLEATLLAELLLDALDVGSEAVLTVPLETTLITFTFFGAFALFSTAFDIGYENLRWKRLNVQHYELLPVEVQIEWRLLGVHGRVLHWDIN